MFNRFDKYTLTCYNFLRKQGSVRPAGDPARKSYIEHISEGGVETPSLPFQEVTTSPGRKTLPGYVIICVIILKVTDLPIPEAGELIQKIFQRHQTFH